MKIIDNKIFKNLKFWNDLLDLEMNLEIQKKVKAEFLDCNFFGNSNISSDEIREKQKKI